MKSEDIVKPRNLDTMQILSIDNLEIVEWHELPNGAGKPSQVHMLFTVVGIPMRLAFRYKSRRAVQSVIDALTKHMNNVWPE